MEDRWRSGLGWGVFSMEKSRFRGYNIIRVIWEDGEKRF